MAVEAETRVEVPPRPGPRRIGPGSPSGSTAIRISAPVGIVPAGTIARNEGKATRVIDERSRPA